MTHQSPSRLPRPDSKPLRLMQALWHMGATLPASAVTQAACRNYLHVADMCPSQFNPIYLRNGITKGWVARRADHLVHLTQDGRDLLLEMEQRGLLRLYRSSGARVPESALAPSTSSPPVPPPEQASTVHGRSFGYVSGGAAHLPAPVRADGLVHRGLPSRRGNLLVYRDGTTEPVPGTAPQPATHQRPQRAWDLQQIAQAQPATTTKEAA